MYKEQIKHETRRYLKKHKHTRRFIKLLLLMIIGFQYLWKGIKFLWKRIKTEIEKWKVKGRS